MLIAAQFALLGGASAPPPLLITATGAQTISPLAWGAATAVKIEAYGAGGGGGTYFQGGGGGGYSCANRVALLGLTGLYVTVPVKGTINNVADDAFVRANNSSGTVLCLAKGGSASGAGGAAASGVGDTKFTGGAGLYQAVIGGGAAGPLGDGPASNASSSANSGGYAGRKTQGSTAGIEGDPYGGGGWGGNGQAAVGAQGLLLLTWLV